MINHEYPRDATGDALRRVQADGSDMSAPMDVDFVVAAPSEAAAHLIAEKARALGYKVKAEHTAANGNVGQPVPPWTCCCTRRMVASYEAVVHAEHELNLLARPFEGHAEGWGTFGNVEGNGAN